MSATPSATGEHAVVRVDHVTVPCSDLDVAEAFYVGVLGGRVSMRISAAMLIRLGWSSRDVVANHGVHLRVVLGAGPTIDLFEYPAGTPTDAAPMHPHIAFHVEPASFGWWVQHLTDHAVPIAGPTRPGPPGQGSFYFNDPFGNHLEILTMGIDSSALPVGVPDRSGLDHTWIAARPA
ncbi:MAG TPA: VOC family protein [Pseudonocardia sp.]|nr:VOC family protein [Pseudonocardia sp.]